jgi:hypothetical protein
MARASRVVPGTATIMEKRLGEFKGMVKTQDLGNLTPRQPDADRSGHRAGDGSDLASSGGMGRSGNVAR